MPSFLRTLLPLSLFISAFLLLPSSALSQIPPAGDTTSTPAPGEHDYFHSPVETVNPANGSVSIRIPVRMAPGRQLTVPFSFAYDSNGAFYMGPPTSGSGGSPRYETITAINAPSNNSIGGWSYSYPVVSFQSGTWTIPGSNDNLITCYGSFNYVFQDPMGNRHNLNLSVSANVASPDGYDNCNEGVGGEGQFTTGAEGPVAATTSSPQSNIGYYPAISVVDGNGTGYSFAGGTAGTYLAQVVADRNGNTVTLSNSGYPNYIVTYKDTIGRTALTTSGLGGNPDTVTLAGLSSSYKAYWTTASPSFTDNMLDMCTGAGCQGCPTTMSANSEGISNVVLPNGQQFTFTYDPTYGMLTKIVYPSGGYVRYVWGLNSQAEAIQTTSNANGNNYLWDCRYDFPAITDRYVSYDGSTETLHQHFTYSTIWPNNTSLTWTTKTTTVTTTDSVRNTSFTTVYSYSPLNAPHVPNSWNITPQVPVESSINYYDTTGSLLKTVTKSWGNVRILASEQTTLNDNNSTLVVNCYDVNEQITESDEYNLGTSAPTLPTCGSAPPGTQSGPLIRKTTKTYATFSGAHIVDLPATVITYDGSGNRVAETDTSYDQTGNANRGNPTTIVKRCFTAPGGQACPESDSPSTFTYDNNGQMLSMTDARGNTTSYSYADSYSNCGGSAPPTSPSDAYLTQVTYPTTNGISHIESRCYDYTSGLSLSTTDQNNLTTNYKFADSLDRLTETDFPDGGKTTLAYNDTPRSPTVTSTKKINSSGLTSTSVAIANGFGQVKQTQLTSDPQGTVYQDTTYDGLGRVYMVSNPYRSGSDPTTSAGTTIYVYDALGRKLTETYPDNSVVTTAYCGPNTLVTDPTGKWRRSRVDGLGRLVEIDEPNAPGASVNSNGCPVGGDPIWVTTYGYDGLGNLNSVLQNGSHSRSFTYDSLSRLLCSSNPENSFVPCPTNAPTSAYTPGTIGYTYDADGNVYTKTVSTSQLAGTSGSGSATVNGSEQSIPGAPGVSGTGSVTFSGTLQSTQIQTQAATHATGSVSISGSEQSGNFCDDSGRNCHFKYDLGTVTIDVNGGTSTVYYGRYDTSSTVASNLASALNSGGVVTATVNGSTISITSVATGTSANYTLSASSVTNDPTDFGFASFTPFPSGSTLTGGANAVYTTRYDSGTSTITVNGHADTVSWSGSGTTSSSIASSLSSAINADSGAYVSASASGATVNLTAKTVGVSTDYSLSSSYTYDSTDFSSSSFTSSNSGANLTGGRDPGTTVYDSGSVWITLNGTPYPVSYDQSSTSASLASALASAINSGSLATASANGSGITITATAVGAVTNYSLSSGSSTSQPGSFSSPSFSVSLSGGSLTGGTDPDSPVTTSYTYDALNRPLSRSYSNGDPTVSITYDQSNCLGLSACQNIGHQTSMTDAAGSEEWSYEDDSTNIAHANQRTTSNITKFSTYTADYAGNITKVVYPSGRIVNYTYDAADRPQTATDGSNGITYASDFESAPTGCLPGAVCYTPQGALYALSIGQSSSFTGLNLSYTYNSRLQSNEFKASSSGGNAMDITYGFVDPVTSHNAGHVYAITNNLDGTRSQTFTYDQLNRITGALTTSTYSTSPGHCWGEAYSLDAWGNLNSIAATTNSNYNGCSVESGFTVTADGNNHLPTFSYDLRGNTQSDGSISYTWDAESELNSATNNGVTTNYVYDGEGRRASKSSGKLYWYGSGGDILAETDASGNTTAEYIFFGGKRIAMLPAGGNPIYYVEDLLGTSRVITTNTGVVCYDADFYPFGGERAYANSCSQNYKFEGKERDTETGNDDFGARYYSNRFARWLSSDWSSVPVPIPYANLSNPQTLNLYAMVSDDPESFADLDGHVVRPTSLDDPIADWNAGIDALGCDREPESCMSVLEASAEQTEIAAQNQAEQSARQQQAQTANQQQAQAILRVAVIRSANLSDLGQKDVNAQLQTLTTDMAKLGITVQVISDTTTSLDKAQFQKGALNIVAGTADDFGTSNSGSGWVTSGGQKFAGMRINEYANGSDKPVMSHEVLHFLNGDNRPGVDGRSFWRETRVDWQIFKLNHDWTKSMQGLKNNLGELNP
jgi:RHS repeat-associated protein